MEPKEENFIFQVYLIRSVANTYRFELKPLLVIQRIPLCFHHS